MMPTTKSILLLLVAACACFSADDTAEKVERADLVGQLINFDFSHSPAVKNLLGSSEFGRLAQAYLFQYFRSITANQPVVVFLEENDPDLAARIAEEMLAELFGS